MQPTTRKRWMNEKYINMFSHQVSYRVCYADTDQMGYVYYGNYATYFEVARVEGLVIALDNRVARRIDLGRHLGSTQQLDGVGERAVATWRYTVINEWHRLAGTEDHVVLAELDVLLGVARQEGELGWRRLDALQQPVGVKEDHFALNSLALTLE